MRCVIFTGGTPEPFLPEGVEPEGALIIAADSGYLNCAELGLVPDLAIGDFDSLGEIPENVVHTVFPKESEQAFALGAELAKRYCSTN